MSERAAGGLLVALRRAATLHRLYGADHPLTRTALAEAAETSAGLAPSRPAQLTLVDDSVYLDRTLLPVASLAHNGFVRVLQERGVVSITLVPPVRAADLARLTAVLAGETRDFPTEGSVRLNQDNLSAEDLAPDEGHRSAYAATLDLLRAVSMAVLERDRVSLSGAALAVRTLMDLCVEDPTAAVLLSTMKSHHEYTFYHSVNTCILTLMMGRAVGLDPRDQVLLGMGALLHDIGKIGVPESVLQHPGRLSPEQWSEVRRHPQEGAEAILTASDPGQEVVAVVALEHHARYDGSGYPNLLYFEEPPQHTGHAEHHHPLHLFSRLTAVADGYDAITSRRAYRRPETPVRALQVLLDGAGTMYDPDVVYAFIDVVGEYPPGSLLRLRGGEIVVVTQPAPDPTGPVPALLVGDAAGRRLPAPEPRPFARTEVTAHLTPDLAGITPASVLEYAGAPAAG
jgi:HD-GYP domain-containing protein (c-di-GMP phosphodiesterase class II)